jgi:hypothetical protein
MTEGCVMCEGESFQDMVDKIEKDIAGPLKCGVIGVFGEDSAPFNYTVGLSDLGWPELIISGLDLKVGVTLLNNVVRRCLEDLGAPIEGIVVKKAANFPLRLQSISDEQRDQYMTISVKRQTELTGSPPRALQVVYPDPEGRYPDDPECEAKTSFLQQLPTDEQKERVQ